MFVIFRKNINDKIMNYVGISKVMDFKFMWSFLMFFLFVVFVIILVKYFYNFESDLMVIDLLVLLFLVLFVLFYIRFYLGGMNFNKIVGEIGINIIFYSYRF